MNTRNAICTIIAVTMLVGGVAAQSSDWKAVQSLPPGTDIEVRAPHSLYCTVLSVTPEKLSCSKQRFGEFVFPRGQVREVRLRKGKHNDKWGEGIGVAAGVGLGIAEKSPIVAAAAGSAGYIAGYIVGGGSQLFLHGKVIYRK